MQPTAGAAGEEGGGGPAEHQGVSAADGARGAAQGPGQSQSLPEAKGDRKFPEAERGRQMV